MSPENIESLLRVLRFLGFAECIPLTEEFFDRVNDNTIMLSIAGEIQFDEARRLDLSVYFKRSKTTGQFYFSYYTVTIDADEGPNFKKFHTFYVNKGTGMTLKEAYNLLMGRSVYKQQWTPEGERYYAWIKLNLLEGDEDGFKVIKYRSGFDLEKALAQYPIRELQEEEIRRNLIMSLQKGNIHLVTFVKSGRTEQHFIEACPERRCIIITRFNQTLENSAQKKEKRRSNKKKDT